MIFTVHLNRLIDENTPLEQSRIETCRRLQEVLQVPESYENFLWHRVKVRSMVTGLRHDDERDRRDDDHSHRRVSIMSSLDAGWFRLITNILIQSRDLAMIARWHQCGTMTSQMLARASFPPSVWPSSRSNFDLRPSPSDSTEKTLSYQSLWFWSAVSFKIGRRGESSKSSSYTAFACSVCWKRPAVPNFVRSCSKKPILHAKKRQRFTQVDRIAGPFPIVSIRF